MAYTSDRRVKNLLKDIHLEIMEELKPLGLSEQLKLRIFDESKEDDLLWEEGGLTFSDPITKHKYGSNDCGWYYLDKNIAVPVVVVEGTFGTEHGQFGNGQLNRLSHSFGVAKNGYVGVYFVPFNGESYKKNTSWSRLQCQVARCKVMPDAIIAALNLNKKVEGRYFFIDAYDTDTLKQLVINKFLQMIGRENSYEVVENNILKKMQSIAETKKTNRSATTNNAFYSDGTPVNGHVRIFNHNFEALTTAQKRDGHGMFGRVIADIQTTGMPEICIYLRLDSKEIELLRKRKSKELVFVFQNCEVVPFDCLQFDEEYMPLYNEICENKTTNYLHTPRRDIPKRVIEGLEAGKIRIVKKRDQNP